jgi:transcriptional regulator with XRE-family HTH domain
MTCAAAVHDTMTAKKTHGCICPAADRATMRYEKQLRGEHARGLYRLVDVLGPRRRLRALVAIGYSQPELGRRLGVSQARVWQYLDGPRPKMRRPTAERIAALYDELADTPSTGPQSTRSRNVAVARGWLPPLWWDDDTIDDPSYRPCLRERERSRQDVDFVVVDRLVAGQAVDHVTPAERRLAFHRLRAAKVRGEDIMRRLGLSGSTFARYRDAAGISDANEAAA